LDEKIKWMTNLDEKINPSKNDKSPSRYQQGIDFSKTNTLPIGYLQGI